MPKRENASLTLVQGNICMYWSENMKILDFSSKTIVLRVILCEKSIQRISKRQNASLTIILEKLCFYRNASVMRWIDFSHKITFRTMILEEKLKIFIFSLQHIYFPESGSRMHFHASGMRAIDFSPRNYSKKLVFRKKSEKNFRVETQFYPDFQGQT